MTSTFVQRQVSMTMVPGDSTELNNVGMASSIFQISDTYPANILKLDPGSVSRGTLLFTTTTSPALPQEYANTEWLLMLFRTDKNLKVTVTSPDHSSSSHLIKAGTATDSYGFAMYMDRVTTVTLENDGVGDATADFFFVMIPEDLEDADVWRSGAQTTGISGSSS